MSRSLNQSESLIGAPVATSLAPAWNTARTRSARQSSIVPLVKDLVMSTPPTIGALASSSAITSPLNWRNLRSGFATGTQVAVDFSAPFDYALASNITQLGSTYPDYGYTACNSPAHPNSPSAVVRTRFHFDGTQLEINFKNYNGMTWQLYVDGQAVSASATSVTGTPSLSILPVTFATRAPRLIEWVSAMPFNGLQTAQTDTVWKPMPLSGPRCIVVGDSYSAGTGADAPGITGWVQKFASIMGWPDTWAAAEGGSGYLSSGQGTPFSTRVAADVTANNPDIVIVVGGHNDSSSSAASIQAAAQSLFQSIKTGSPKAKLVVVGPLGAQGAQASYVAMQAALFSAAAGYADLTIDTMTKPWFYGTGYQGATTGNGNDDFYIWTDNVHPSQAGHEYLARRISAEVSRWLGA